MEATAACVAAVHPVNTYTHTPLFFPNMFAVFLLPHCHSAAAAAIIITTQQQTGYLSMDQARSLLPLEATDANVRGKVCLGGVNVWGKGAWVWDGG